VDVARDTLRKDLASLEEQNLIMDRGKQRQGTKARWRVVDELHARHLLAEQVSRDSLTRRIQEGRITTIEIPSSIEIPFSRLVTSAKFVEGVLSDLSRPGDAESERARTQLSEISDKVPVVRVSMVNYRDTPVPNDYIGKCLKDLVNSACELPAEQLKALPNHHIKEEDVEMLMRLKYSIVIEVDYSNLDKWTGALVGAKFGHAY